jgi:hypothetical protein
MCFHLPLVAWRYGRRLREAEDRESKQYAIFGEYSHNTAAIRRARGWHRQEPSGVIAHSIA